MQQPAQFSSTYKCQPHTPPAAHMHSHVHSCTHALTYTLLHTCTCRCSPRTTQHSILAWSSGPRSSGPWSPGPWSSGPRSSGPRSSGPWTGISSYMPLGTLPPRRTYGQQSPRAGQQWPTALRPVSSGPAPYLGDMACPGPQTSTEAVNVINLQRVLRAAGTRVYATTNKVKWRN